MPQTPPLSLSKDNRFKTILLADVHANLYILISERSQLWKAAIFKGPFEQKLSQILFSLLFEDMHFCSLFIFCGSENPDSSLLSPVNSCAPTTRKFPAVPGSVVGPVNLDAGRPQGIGLNRPRPGTRRYRNGALRRRNKPISAENPLNNPISLVHSFESD